MKNAQKKAEQIAYYYLFHKKIELIFEKGFNHLYEYSSTFLLKKIFLTDDVNKKEEFYILEEDWIKNWKSLINYDYAKKILDTIDVLSYKNENEYMTEIKERCDNMVLTGEINNDSTNEAIITYNNNGIYGRKFIHKLILDLNYFDALVDQATFKLFSGYKIKKENYIQVNGLLLDKMIGLLIREERKMKFLFSYENNIIQLTADFNNIENNIKLVGYAVDKAIQIYDLYFYSKLLKQKSDKTLNEFIEQGIILSDNVIITTSEKEGKQALFKLNNDTFFQDKYIFNNIIKNKLGYINTPKFIGLANIGATCYMNATLQNLINIDLLTRYLLTEKNYLSIISAPNNFELSNKYCEVLYNTCIDNDKKYYEPYNFKEVISRKNPLFEGVQANDSKDLVNFLLEEMHTELKLLENNNSNDNLLAQIPPNINNQFLILNNFRKAMNESNRSIISKLFYILVESLTHCHGCNYIIYNYEVNFFIEFPLENVFNYCCKNNIPVMNTQTNKINIPLIQCFNNYLQPTLFTGENQIYCTNCKKQNNATYTTNFFSFSPVLIIILNRGRGNVFNCEVDFPLDLNLGNYCKNFEGNVIYKLKGVITHLGPSGASGHFIAYCRHRITNEWYCYNDSIVSKLDDQINGYKQGTPYILFYEGQDNSNNFVFPDNYNMMNMNMNLNMNFNQSGNFNFMNNQYNNMIMNQNNFNNNNLNINSNNNFNLNNNNNFNNMMNNNININNNMNNMSMNNSMNNMNINNNMINMNMNNNMNNMSMNNNMNNNNFINNNFNNNI